MSSTVVTSRIFSRELVTFASDDDPTETGVPWQARNAWTPRIVTGGYEAIKPDFSTPMETKSTRLATGDLRRYPAYLATIFFVGVVIFVIGTVMLVVSVKLNSDWLTLSAWVVITLGAAIFALSLLRAQDLDPRP